MRLKSDFIDFYDHAFDSSMADTPIFERLSEGGMNRRDILKFLDSVGLRTPIHGTVGEVTEKMLKELPSLPLNAIIKIWTVVVYVDENKHRGDGKLNISMEEALKNYLDYYCTEFIPVLPSTGSMSMRYLQVGKRKRWLRYWSSDWRSNYGRDVKIEVLCEEEKGYHPKIKYPLFAVDFLPANKLYAVDFNIAPSLDPLKELITPKEVVREIEEFYKENQK